MVSYDKNDMQYSQIQEFSFKGLSADEKPLDAVDGIHIKNGSTYYEIDTGSVYMYDESGKAWIEQ